MIQLHANAVFPTPGLAARVTNEPGSSLNLSKSGMPQDIGFALFIFCDCFNLFYFEFIAEFDRCYQTCLPFSGLFE